MPPTDGGSGSRPRAVALGGLRENVSRWETGKRVPGQWWLRHLATVLQVPIEILEQVGVDRRHFLTDAVGVSIAPLVASDLIEHGFAAALHGGHPTADDWGHAVDTYGRDYMTSGAGEIQQRLAADLVVLQQQLDSPYLWAVGATLATLYGKTFPGRDGAGVTNRLWQICHSRCHGRRDRRAGGDGATGQPGGAAIADLHGAGDPGGFPLVVQPSSAG